MWNIRSRGQIPGLYIDRRIIIHTVPPGKSLFQDLHTCLSLPLSSSPILAAPPSSLSNVTSLGTSSSSNQTSNVGAHSTFQPMLVLLQHSEFAVACCFHLFACPVFLTHVAAAGQVTDCLILFIIPAPGMVLGSLYYLDQSIIQNLSELDE